MTAQSEMIANSPAVRILYSALKHFGCISVFVEFPSEEETLNFAAYDMEANNSTELHKLVLTFIMNLEFQLALLNKAKMFGCHPNKFNKNSQ
jgi:hypothetical protein